MNPRDDARHADQRGSAPTAGEAWAQEQLVRLRDEGFAAPAVAGFLGESSRRARANRALRPALRRRSRRWIGAGAATWIALAASGREPYRRQLGAAAAWWMGVALMLDWHLGMFETEGGQARNLGPADALTLTRAWLVPALADSLRPGLVIAAATTDVLDGIAARATAPTRAGRDLEGMVDGVAAAATLIGAARGGAISQAATACEATRLAAALAYGGRSYLVHASPPDPEVSRASRATTPLRIGGLLVAASGRRRAGSALLAAGSVIGLAAAGASHSKTWI